MSKISVSYGGDVKKENIITIVFLLFLTIFTGVDIVSDLNEGLDFDHLLHEVIIFVMALIIVSYKVIASIKKDRVIDKLSKNASEASIEVNYYKQQVQKYRDGVGEILTKQFKIWGLTDSESDIALLLVKGSSMKEVASIRGTGESTVRQQATSIYKKSGLENRNQLVSYFLEDLF